MKLISMTDFVLEQRGDNLKYAQFLKTTLNLGMFLPCVDNVPFNYSLHGNSNEYREAKERVLFEGFEDIEAIQHHVHQKRTIEYFSKFNTLTLTKSAQKQLGL